jgi:hypothetical protein
LKQRFSVIRSTGPKRGDRLHQLCVHASTSNS